MSRIRSRAAIAALVAAVSIIPAVAGCGQAAEQVAEQAAEQALGGDVDVNDEGVTVTDDEGNQVAIGEDVSIPDTWPAEVPLLDGGTPQMASVQADGSASVMWVVEATPEEAAKAYGDSLVAAGYTEESTSTMGGMVLNEYSGNGYVVSVNALDVDGTTNVMVAAEKDS
jgi:predicted lysophospholipase L1 biosynthesis ABC-type transport system permease subunit